MALEEWKLRLTSAKVEVEVEAELGNRYLDIIATATLCAAVVIITL